MQLEKIKIGDTRCYKKIVQQHDVAQFDAGMVHEVYSTFAITRDAEWCGRLFVLDIKEDDEEGIGTSVEVKHLGPAFVGDEVEFTSTYAELSTKGEIITTFEAIVKHRIIATGYTSQKILDKEKIASVFSALRQH
jgi:fluoroacetyl-CoA thioesterase